MALLIQNAETLIPILRLVGIICAAASVPLLILTIYLYFRLDIKFLRVYVKNRKPKVKYEFEPEEKPKPSATKTVVGKIPPEVLKKLDALLGDGDISQTEGWQTTFIPATNWQNIYKSKNLQGQMNIEKPNCITDEAALSPKAESNIQT